MYDAIVVGARCAGSPTAMLLARKGYSVLLLDKASFHSDTMSTHFIHLPGVVRLKRWGLLERLVATGCPPIEGATLHFGEVTFNPPIPATLPHDIPPQTFAYYSYWSGVPLDGLQLYFFDDIGMIACPTHHGLSCIAVGGPNARFHELRKDIEGNFLRTLQRAPELAERVRQGKRQERFVG